MAAVDFDGRYTTDLLLAAVETSGSSAGLVTGLGIAFSGPNGTMDKTAKPLVMNNTQNIGLVLVGELTGDGRPDVLVTPGPGSNIPATVFVNPGSAPPWNGHEIKEMPSIPLQWAELRDLDRDGDLDLLVAATKGNSPLSGIYLLENTGDKSKGYFGRATLVRKVMANSVASGARVRVTGDLDGLPATGVTINGSDVMVRNISAVRGFAVGGEVLGDKALLESVTVVDPDLVGFSLSGAKGAVLSDCGVKQLFQGVGLRLENSSGVVLRGGAFCPEAWQGGAHSPLSLECRGSTVAPSKARLGLNNGCTLGSAWEPCR